MTYITEILKSSLAMINLDNCPLKYQNFSVICSSWQCINLDLVVRIWKIPKKRILDTPPFEQSLPHCYFNSGLDFSMMNQCDLEHRFKTNYSRFFMFPFKFKKNIKVTKIFLSVTLCIEIFKIVVLKRGLSEISRKTLKYHKDINPNS